MRKFRHDPEMTNTKLRKLTENDSAENQEREKRAYEVVDDETG